MSIGVNIGDKLPLNLLLEDGATNKYPQANVFDQNGFEVSGSPFSLSHLSMGYYINNSYTVDNSDTMLTAIYRVYDDPAHTVESQEYMSRSQDIFTVNNSSGGGGTAIGGLSFELIGVIESDDDLY